MIVGLTGGIASGKSLTCSIFRTLGVSIVDADQIARQLLLDPNILNHIIVYFGDSYLTSGGILDRMKLRQHIFRNPAKRRWLNNYLHPLIRKEITSQTIRFSSSYCILDIPLLIENNLQSTVDKVLVVDSPEFLQVRRAQKRDNCSVAIIREIIAIQSTRKQRLLAADDIILNNKGLNYLKKIVRNLHKKYSDLQK